MRNFRFFLPVGQKSPITQKMSDRMLWVPFPIYLSPHTTHMQKRNTPQVLILACARGSIIYADLDAPWMWWLGAANIRSFCSLRAFFTGTAAWRRFVLRRVLAGAPAGTTTESSWGDELG